MIVKILEITIMFQLRQGAAKPDPSFCHHQPHGHHHHQHNHHHHQPHGHHHHQYHHRHQHNHHSHNFSGGVLPNLTHFSIASNKLYNIPSQLLARLLDDEYEYDCLWQFASNKLCNKINFKVSVKKFRLLVGLVDFA